MVSTNEMRDIEEEMALKYYMPTSRNPTGHAVFVDDFEKTGIYPFLQDTGTVVIDDTVRFRGSKSLKFTTGASQWNKAIAIVSWGILPDGKFGIEFWWNTEACEQAILGLLIKWYDKTNVYDFGVYHDMQGSGHKWYYKSGLPDTWTAISGGSQTLQTGDHRANVWHYLKFTWDHAAKKYRKLISDELELDLSALDLPSTEDTTFPRIEVALYFQTVEAAAKDGWVDDFNFTEDEI